ncbi:hypothetical protein [Sporosarcina sp. FSL W7-1283]|uniref:hypothetical protein n=1 Tax=Sporosarcina sp. FSL W7-1283 TaxID=2921560 RepID=UPI0030F82AA2
MNEEEARVLRGTALFFVKDMVWFGAKGVWRVSLLFWFGQGGEWFGSLLEWFGVMRITFGSASFLRGSFVD